jgi:hypothetical protein
MMCMIMFMCDVMICSQTNHMTKIHRLVCLVATLLLLGLPLYKVKCWNRKSPRAKSSASGSGQASAGGKAFSYCTHNRPRTAHYMSWYWYICGMCNVVILYSLYAIQTLPGNTRPERLTVTQKKLVIRKMSTVYCKALNTIWNLGVNA